MLKGGSKNGGRSGSSLAGRLHRFIRGRDGVAIVDFALVAPLLVFLLLGSMEIGRYVLLNQSSAAPPLVPPTWSAKPGALS